MIFRVLINTGLICVLLTSSCKTKTQQKKISTTHLLEARLDDNDCTEVKIITTFPNDSICKEDRSYANLYICKRNTSNDPLYVFDLCNKAPAFTYDRNIKDNLCIMKEDRLAQIPRYVSVLVPKEFVILLIRSLFSPD